MPRGGRGREGEGAPAYLGHLPLDSRFRGVAGATAMWGERAHPPSATLDSRLRRPLHNRHPRTSPTVIPAKAGIQGGASGWRGLLHLHDLALHGELCKGLPSRE